MAVHDSPLALSIQGLRKSYKDVVAVDGLDLEVRTGECFGLLGPNGAGKTTTIEICEGLTEADAGEVLLFGEPPRGHRFRERIGVSLQETRLAEKLTVGETLRLFRSFYRQRRSVEEVLAAVQLGEKRRARVGQLSGGQRQRLALACALVGEPQLFFLDEPTTGLDPQSRRQLWDLIEGFKRDRRTILLTTHYMEEAERLCDRVAIVDKGRVIALGTPHELVESLGVQHVVEFRLQDGRSLETAALAGLPGVRGVRQEADRHLLEAGWLHEVVPSLLGLAAREGVVLAHLATHRASLEDVFVHLTGRHLRDD